MTSLPARQIPASTPAMASGAIQNFAAGTVASPSPASTAAAAADSHDGLLFHQYMLAGSIAGIVEHTAMFPVDTLKTRMQVAASPPLRISALSFAGLYRGVAAMALGAGPAHAVYFSVYEICKNFLVSPENSSGSNHAAHAASGVVATIASDAVLTPMDTVKQRLQVTGSPYRGVADCVSRVVREEGVGALYRSYRTTVLMNAPFTAVHFATYEAVKKAMVGGDGEEGLREHATAGAIAGALAAVVTTPLDVVKTQLQCQGVGGVAKLSSSTMREVARSIVKKEGYAGLMRGWKPRMLFHAPAAAFCWSTYEGMKYLFQTRNKKLGSSGT